MLTVRVTFPLRGATWSERTLIVEISDEKDHLVMRKSRIGNSDDLFSRDYLIDRISLSSSLTPPLFAMTLTQIAINDRLPSHPAHLAAFILTSLPFFFFYSLLPLSRLSPPFPPLPLLTTTSSHYPLPSISPSPSPSKERKYNPVTARTAPTPKAERERMEEKREEEGEGSFDLLMEEI